MPPLLPVICCAEAQHLSYEQHLLLLVKIIASVLFSASLLVA
jgi:hypothetical protein